MIKNSETKLHKKVTAETGVKFKTINHFDIEYINILILKTHLFISLK